MARVQRGGQGVQEGGAMGLLDGALVVFVKEAGIVSFVIISSFSRDVSVLVFVSCGWRK